LKSLLLGPLAKAFSLAVDARYWLYKKEILNSRQVSVPVISVGNITLGGTGKTPFVDLIVKYLTEKNKNVGLVSRGYGAKEKKRGIIDQNQKNYGNLASQFGDEPTMLQWRNPTLHVVVNPNRYRACQELINKKSVEIIVADDAFQHLALKRDLDLVLLDATESYENFKLLPLGRMREGFSSLERASLVILNKANLVSLEKVQNLRDLVFSKCSFLKNEPNRWLEANYEFEGFFHLETDKPWSGSYNEKLLVLSGIANNQTFFKMCRDKFGKSVYGEMGFSDHYVYSKTDMALIMIRAKELGADRILITEKDAVKISQWKSDIFVYTKLKVSLVGDGRKLYDKIDQIIS